MLGAGALWRPRGMEWGGRREEGSGWVKFKNKIKLKKKKKKELTSQCRRCKRPGFDTWVGKIPWSRNHNPLQYSCLENFMDKGVWGLQSMGSQRVRHNWPQHSTALATRGQIGQKNKTEKVATVSTEIDSQLFYQRWKDSLIEKGQSFDTQC